MKVEVIEAADEMTVARAARNCYLGTLEPDVLCDPEEFMAGDMKELFEHLLMRGHYGPFEQANVTFYIEGISRVTMAQLTRHRHVTFDIQSFRYTAPEVNFIKEISEGYRPLEDIEKYVVIPKLAREQDEEEMWRGMMLWRFSEYARLKERYEEEGVPPKRAKEDLRYLLPKALKVNVVCTMNLRMLMHVADMRAAGDAQWEIREMTEKLLDKASEEFPITMELYDDKLKNRKNRLAP